ncbi:MAG TPA: hypothetical protein VKM55_26510 [Candidatus Lokiarchaeia archaeon]|nr:hypothetical protein [Candidatus Lokiarchaeia archaeon]
MDVIYQLAYYSTFSVYLFGFGIGITYKAIKKRLSNVIFFALFQLTFGSYFLFLLFKNFGGLAFVPDFMLEMIYCSSVTFFFLFNFTTFFAKNRPFFITFFSACVVLSGISCTLAFGSASASGIGIYNILDFIRYFLDDCVFVQIVSIPSLIVALQCVVKARRECIQSYIRSRYILYSISLIVSSGVSILNFVSIIVSTYSFYIVVAIGLFSLWEILLSYFTWFFPAALIKIRSNVEFEGDPWISQEMSEHLPANRIMNIIDYFGNLLSNAIGKSSDACKGLLIIAITRTYGENGLNNITIDELRLVFTSELKKMLSTSNVSVPEGFLENLAKRLDKDRFFFTMARL